MRSFATKTPAVVAMVLLGLAGPMVGAAAQAQEAAGEVGPHGKRLALLVGINDYLYPEIPALRGAVNDIALMRQLLKTQFGFPDDEEHIRVLTDKQATQEAILKAFREHLIAKADKDTIAVFHFSGHGSQRATDNREDEPDGWDETIVPYDSGRDPHPARDIIDDTLGELFEQLRAKTPYITFVFDSCHSGDVSKDIDQPREAPPDPRKSPPTADGSRGLRGDGRRDYAQISGCRSSQRSFEYYTGSQRQGTLTYFLVEEIKKAGSAPITYRQIMEKVAAKVTAVHPLQTPQVEGEGLDRVVFGVQRIVSEPYVLVSPTGAFDVTVEAGRVHGMTPGSVFDVYAPGTSSFRQARSVAQVELKEVNAVESKARVLRRGNQPIEAASRAVERVHRYESKPFRVFFDPESYDSRLKKRGGPIACPARDAVRRKIVLAKELASLIRLVDEGRDAHLSLRTGEGPQGRDRLVLFVKGNADPLKTFLRGDTAADQIVAEVRRWAAQARDGGSGPRNLFLDAVAGDPVISDVASRIGADLRLAATFELVDRDGLPKLVVRRLGDQPDIALFSGEGALLKSAPVPENAPDAGEHLLDQLYKWARWFGILELQNAPPADLANKVRFEVRPVDGGAAAGTNHGIPQAVANSQVELSVENKSDGKIYFSILDLSDNGSVSVLHPTRDTASIERGDSWRLQMEVDLTDGRDPTRDDLKLVVTQRPIDLRSLEQPGIKGDPLEALLNEAMSGQKLVKPPVVGADGWLTDVKPIEVVRRKANP